MSADVCIRERSCSKYNEGKEKATRKPVIKKRMPREEYTDINSVKTAANRDISDRAVLVLLERIKANNDPAEIRRLTDELERAIFHRQYETD